MMQQLVNIPANELKIDRAFVKNMHANSSDRVMVEKTIEIGHELGMSVTAEGVETETQPSFLRGKGRDRAQGFLFSRPLAPAAMTKWLSDHHARSAHGLRREAPEIERVPAARSRPLGYTGFCEVRNPSSSAGA
jgi:EAL domain-containing protein (putative c-di-GMP-specific phosphodiesterase class I)